MQMEMKIEAIPERPDDSRNPRLEGRSGHGPEINKNRSEDILRSSVLELVSLQVLPNRPRQSPPLQ